MDENPENDNKLGIDEVLRLSLTDPSKPLRLYCNRERALKTTRGQVLGTFIPIALIVITFSVAYTFIKLFLGDTYANVILHTFTLLALLLIPFSFLADFIINSVYKKEIQQSTTPVLDIDENGISIRCSMRNFEKIPWSYIREVQTFSWPLWRAVRIIPYDRSSLRQFAIKDESRLTQIMYGASRSDSMVFTPPYIDVPESLLPLDADEVAEAMNLRLYHVRKIESGN